MARSAQRHAEGRAAANGVGGRPAKVAGALPLALGVAAVVLLAAGWGHRVMLASVDRALGQVVEPKQPLASLPMRLGDWSGQDTPVDEAILRVKNFDDDHVSRLYVRWPEGPAVALFVGYQGRPRVSFGHRPDHCYPFHGWEQVSQESVFITTSEGMAVPSFLYEFRRPNGLGRSLLVLATYVINGRYCQDSQRFDRWTQRGAGLLGERPAYLTRIQLSLETGVDRSTDLDAMRDLAALVAARVVQMMPYWER